MSQPTFHLGLCMAGSVSAGAYTAGVIDFLLEALTKWEAARGRDPSIPNHRVEIDLLGGSSGGGITAGMAFFGMRDQVEHPVLNPDNSYTVNSDKNIFWKTWVELTGNSDVFSEMLDDSDIQDYHIPSAMNSRFIDAVADNFEQYVRRLAERSKTEGNTTPPFLSRDLELFMTLFNVTGIKYQLSSRASAATEQYVSEHRDMAHFRWGDAYEGDGRMEVSFNNLEKLKQVIQASKATGAFPIGLRPRIVERQAKYIWDNPFFRKNDKFDQETIGLGKNIREREDLYRSLNADGGTSNNEPVEMLRDMMLQIRLKERNMDAMLEAVNAMSDTERMAEKSKLTNYSVLLIDPFPSYDFDIEEPSHQSETILRYGLNLVGAMRAQLLFDAKEAIDAYDKKSYGLHIVAPSRSDVEKPEHAIACGALGGFGGFISREYRVHDFFLGRHNCQSFLRKYFVVNVAETPGTEHYECVEAVLKGYGSQEALDRFSYTDEKGAKWVPVIPDVDLPEPMKVKEVQVSDSLRKIVYTEKAKLPLYKMDLPEEAYIDNYFDQVKKRANTLVRNAYDSNFLVDKLIAFMAGRVDDKIAAKVLSIIKTNLRERKLMKPKYHTPNEAGVAENATAKSGRE
ncbi:patatin-like phospholipase family protein [Pseudocnuella soli]|uniref:patatin-like phospholipase family protein n=1 Tax=Pseudocnuella soli TaxID=2502779 RepID=UPI001050A457|nr:patatin-like phospholipase family protein [Pseudocnuella soli]